MHRIQAPAHTAQYHRWDHMGAIVERTRRHSMKVVQAAGEWSILGDHGVRFLKSLGNAIEDFPGDGDDRVTRIAACGRGRIKRELTYARKGRRNIEPWTRGR